MVKLGRSGSFRVRVGVKTSVVTDTENETVDGTVASSATVPSRLDGTVAEKVRYRQDGT